MFQIIICKNPWLEFNLGKSMFLKTLKEPYEHESVRTEDSNIQHHTLIEDNPRKL